MTGRTRAAAAIIKRRTPAPPHRNPRGPPLLQLRWVEANEGRCPNVLHSLFRLVAELWKGDSQEAEGLNNMIKNEMGDAPTMLLRPHRPPTDRKPRSLTPRREAVNDILGPRCPSTGLSSASRASCTFVLCFVFFIFLAHRHRARALFVRAM